jgi:hypothetical protein
MIAGMTLYTPLDQRDLRSDFPGATALRIVLPGRVEEIPVTMRRAAITRPTPGENPVNGEADLLLQVSGQPEIDLAKYEGAVALAVLYAAGDAAIYWLKDGRCNEILPRQSAGLVRLMVEERRRVG